MELIDILDERGNPTGKAIAKTEVHRSGLWHRTVHIWIIDGKGRILLQHRSKRMENYPDMWDISVTGHVRSGESTEQAAFREIKEEIGLDLAGVELRLIEIIKGQDVLNNNTYFDNEFNSVYLVKSDLNIDQLVLQEEELAGLRWVPVSELKEWIVASRPGLVPHAEEYKILFEKLDNDNL